jgi:hypothetical protein
MDKVLSKPEYFGKVPGRTTWAINRVLATSKGQFSMGCQGHGKVGPAHRGSDAHTLPPPPPIPPPSTLSACKLDKYLHWHPPQC